MIKDSEKKDDLPPVAAMLRSTATKLHNHCLHDESTKNAMIAFPNDRAASIRSGDHHEHFRYHVMLINYNLNNKTSKIIFRDLQDPGV